MVDRKHSFFEWTSSGIASFPNEHYSFWAGAISHADTSSTGIVHRKEKNISPDDDDETVDWALPDDIYNLERYYDKKLKSHLTSDRTNILSFLKWIDVSIQVFSGTLVFGAIQHAGELLREAYRTKVGFIAAATGFVGGTMAIIGRAGLLVTQILAGALRFPLSILSGTVGLIRGLAAKNEPKATVTDDILHFSKLHLVLTTISDYVWPFAPRSARAISFYLPEKDLQKLATQYTHAATDIKLTAKKSTVVRWVSMLSLTLSLTLIALLATGMLGISCFAALPVVKPIAGATAFALNYLFGWAGLHISIQSAAAAPVLSGLVNWFSVGVFSKQAVVGVMLLGAVSTFCSNILYMFKDNVVGTDQRQRLVSQLSIPSNSAAISKAYERQPSTVANQFLNQQTNTTRSENEIRLTNSNNKSF